MPFKKNTAVTGFPFGLVSATDGSAITTGTVTGYYVLDGGAQGTITAAPVHEGNGQWSVDLTAAEMNGDLVGLIFTHASAINVSFSIKTETKLVSELNDIAATSIVSAGAITTSGGAVSNVTTVATTTTNTDMRGTDNALLAASYTAPDNTSIAAILVDTNELQTNQGNWLTATGFSTHSAADVRTEMDTNSTQLAAIVADTNELQTDDVPGLIAALNNVAATDIVSAGAITTLAGAVVNVDTVDTTTTNTDMRGTDSALLAASAPANFGDLAITVTTGEMTVGTNNDKAGYSISGVITTLDGLNNFNPAVDAVASVTLVATTTTNTDMRGTDNALLAASYTAPDNASIAEILTDTGTTLPATLTDIKGATFSSATDSLEAIRDRGDAAWVTGAGGTPPQLLQSTTIATLATQTSFTLTAGSSDNGAYDGAIVVITDQATAVQKAVGSVSTYVGATKTLTLSADPSIFTMAVGDTIEIIAALGAGGTAPTVVQIRTEMDANSTQLAAIVVDTGTDIPAQITALNDFDPALDTVANVTTVATCTANTDMRGTNNALLAASYTAPDNASITAILADTNELQLNQGNWLTATGFSTFNPATDIVATVTTVTNMRGTDNALLAASYTAPDNASITAILTDTNDLQLNQGNWLTATGFSTFNPAVDVVANVTLVGTTTTNTDMLTAAAVNAEVDTALADFWTSPATLVDLIWDELLTDHNIPLSTGKVLQGISEGWVAAEASINDVAPTTTSFITDLVSTVDSFYSDAALVFITGALKGQSRIITSYDGTTKTLNFDEAFTFAPSDTDQFIILANHTHSISETVQAILDSVIEGTTTLKHSMQISNAGAAGILSGAATSNIAIRDRANTKDRITATVDADGNRSAVTVSVD